MPFSISKFAFALCGLTMTIGCSSILFHHSPSTTITPEEQVRQDLQGYLEREHRDASCHGMPNPHQQPESCLRVAPLKNGVIEYECTYTGGNNCAVEVHLEGKARLREDGSLDVEKPTITQKRIPPVPQ